jgi:hypothetical protein
MSGYGFTQSGTVLTAGGQTVNTDVNGNITLLPTALSSLASTALSMSWDFDNNLKSVDFGNDSSTDVEYKYDALGRHVARVGSGGSYVYVQSDQQTIADYGEGDAPSSPLYRYVYASYIDEPVVRKGAGTGGTIHYYHRNQQHSITSSRSLEKRNGTQNGEEARPARFTYKCDCTIDNNRVFEEGILILRESRFPFPLLLCNIKSWGECN